LNPTTKYYPIDIGDINCPLALALVLSRLVSAVQWLVL
jgi:hypothetical protein